MCPLNIILDSGEEQGWQNEYYAYYNYDPAENKLIVTDLLADVIIYPDGFVKVIDLDELVTALEDRSISLDTLKASLNKLDKPLHIVYSGDFSTLSDYIKDATN